MNIEQFTEQFKNFRDVDQIVMHCDHPEHETEPNLISIGKQPAKRNILKNGGKEFICRNCYLKFNNPMFQKDAQKRQTNEQITVLCPHPDHEGNLDRSMKKCCYYGDMQEPYLQICGSCSQKGKIIKDSTKEAIRKSLIGIPKDEDFKQKVRDFWALHPEYKIQAAQVLEDNRRAGKCVDGMKGKHHSETTKQKMSNKMIGRKYDEKHKNNISIGRKKMLEETGGFTEEHKNNLRKAAIEQYKKGFDPKLHFASGNHDSPKAGIIRFFSSYEKKAFMKLDADENVKSYKTDAISVSYFDPVKNATRSYIIDLMVEYYNGKTLLIEIKPAAYTTKPTNVSKFKAAVIEAEKLGMEFIVWTEVDLFGAVFAPKQIKEFVSKLKNESTEDLEIKRKRNVEKTQRYYEKYIKDDKMLIDCKFCGDTHEIMKLSYNLNLSKNGRYVCPKESSKMQGGKNKGMKKENPYALQSKKECSKCHNILPFENYQKDASRNDGLCNQCKQCRKQKA